MLQSSIHQQNTGVADLDRDVPAQSVDHVHVALNVNRRQVALDAIIIPRGLVFLCEEKAGNGEDSDDRSRSRTCNYSFSH